MGAIRMIAIKYLLTRASAGYSLMVPIANLYIQRQEKNTHTVEVLTPPQPCLKQPCVSLGARLFGHCRSGMVLAWYHHRLYIEKESPQGLLRLRAPQASATCSLGQVYQLLWLLSTVSCTLPKRDYLPGIKSICNNDEVYYSFSIT